MGLIARGRGRGCGNKTNYHFNSPRGGGMISQRPIFRSGPPGILGPPPGFPPEACYGMPPFLGEQSSFNYGPPRPSFGKFFRKNYRKKIATKSIVSPEPVIDLTKPWVTEEIINEENKKQGLLQTWRKTKTEEDWKKYKAQKLTVQSLYEKAKAEYAANHPAEAAHWESISKNKQYYCEMCDKSFRTDDDLILHEAEHETCGRDGCEFTAHPKIIAKHIKMQHMTGLYKRIGKLYTEEDIAKWIEERKKRYPTRKIVEEKKILEQEKLNRGERIKENQSKFNKSFINRTKNLGKKKNFEKKVSRNTKNRRAKKRKKTSVVLKSLEEEEISDSRKGVPAFSGIKSCDEPEIPKKEEFDISDEEWDVTSENKLSNNAEPLLNNSLKLLASFYNSDDEIRNEEKVNLSADEDGAPEEVKTNICKKPLSEEIVSEKKTNPKRKFGADMGKNYSQERKRKNSFTACSAEKRSLSLLEKLLEKEIRHERNVILQCIHYVVQNNFFKP